MSGRLRGAEMEAANKVIEFVFAARNERERDDLAMREQDERRLVHRERLLACLVINSLGAELLAEVGSDKLPRVDLDYRGIAFRLESF